MYFLILKYWQIEKPQYKIQNMKFRFNSVFCYNTLLVLLGIMGFILIVLLTSKYGPYLSPDSISYISTARNLISGKYFTRYDGNPFFYGHHFIQ